MKARLAGWLIGIASALVPAGDVVAEASAPAGADRGDPHQVLVLVDLPPAHFRADGGYAGGYAGPAGSAARRRLVEALARAHGLRLGTGWPLPVVGLDCFVLDVPVDRDPAALAAELGRDAGVAWAQPMGRFHGLSDDPLYDLQPAASAWHLDALHAAATGRHVRVAIVDSGVQPDHPDLRGRIVHGEDFVDGAPPIAAEDHGTAVAGIVAAVAGNRIGIAGVAPEADLLALRACRQGTAGTLCDTLGLARALDAAIAQDAAVVNLSLAGPPDRLVGRLVDAALARGMVVVAAIDRHRPTASFPAGLAGVVAVTDAAPDGAGALGAPGTDVPTTLAGSRWDLVSGSSYAAAHVSGLVALLLDARSRRGAPAAGAASDLLRRPDGRVDACASLARASAGCVCGCEGGPAVAATGPR